MQITFDVRGSQIPARQPDTGAAAATVDGTDRTDADDGCWMTYGQLAEARRITRRAAIRLSQRHRLRRQPGNSGFTLVWVPSDMASSSPHRPPPPETDADDNPRDTPQDVAPLPWCWR